jgi:hypothetical protein
LRSDRDRGRFPCASAGSPSSGDSSRVVRVCSRAAAPRRAQRRGRRGERHPQAEKALQSCAPAAGVSAPASLRAARALPGRARRCSCRTSAVQQARARRAERLCASQRMGHGHRYPFTSARVRRAPCNHRCARALRRCMMYIRRAVVTKPVVRLVVAAGGALHACHTRARAQCAAQRNAPPSTSAPWVTATPASTAAARPAPRPPGGLCCVSCQRC